MKRLAALVVVVALGSGCASAPPTKGERVAANVHMLAAGAGLAGAGFGVTAASFAGAAGDPSHLDTWRAGMAIGALGVLGGAVIMYFGDEQLAASIDREFAAAETTADVDTAAPK